MGHSHCGLHNTQSLALHWQWALHLSSDDEFGKQVVTHSWPKAASHKKWSNRTYLTQLLLESNDTSLPCVSLGNLKLVKTLAGVNCSAYFRIMSLKNPTCLSQCRECAYVWKDFPPRIPKLSSRRHSPLLPFPQCLQSQPIAIQRKQRLTLSRVNCWLVQNMHKESSLCLLLVSWVSQRD